MSIPEVLTRLKQHSTLTSNKMQMIKIISIITLYIKDLHTIIRHNNKRMTEKNILWYHPNFVARKKLRTHSFSNLPWHSRTLPPLLQVLRPYLYVSWYYFIAHTAAGFFISWLPISPFYARAFVAKVKLIPKANIKSQSLKKDVRLPLGLSKSFDLFRK